MSFVFADRVQESSTTSGLGDFTLDGAQLGFQSFLSGIGNANQCYYTISHDTDGSWEVGLGTVNGATLQRDSVLSSSNSGAPVSFALGGKTVFVPGAAQAFEERLTSTDHAIIDHSSLPGVPAPEAFTQVVHDAGDHSSLPGVPAPEAFTEPVHDAHNHAGLPGVPAVGAPAPSTYNVNRVTAAVTVDLTSTTDGIHFISMDSAGLDFGNLQVDVPPAPTDTTPFLVIFNEDVEQKGAMLAIDNGNVVPLIHLKPREGVRLWHYGALGAEWQAERITPLNGTPSEALYYFSGDVNAANDWFRSSQLFTTNPGARAPYQTDRPVLSPTRFLAMSYYASGTGVGDTELAVEDESPSIIALPVLTAGTVTESLPLDFPVVPVLSPNPADSSSIALRYVTGGDKASIGLSLYGFQRDGGLELPFSWNEAGAATTQMWTGPSQTSGTNPSQLGHYAWTIPSEGVIDRLVILVETTATFDLHIRIRDQDIKIISTGGVADTARVVQLPVPMPVSANDRISLYIDNMSGGTDTMRIWARLRGPRGLLLPYAGTDNTLFYQGSADDSSAAAVEANFVAPVALRLLRWSIASDHNYSTNDYVRVLRNGVEISRFEPDDGGGGSGGTEELFVVEAGGIPIAIDQVLTTEISGFIDPVSVLLHVTAEPLTI